MNIYYDYVDATSVVTNEEAINNSLRNILQTRIGSLPGKPEFGSKLHRLLFELMDGIPKELVSKYILEAILKWEPRITVLDIKTTAIPEYNKITSVIYYEYNMLGQYISSNTTIVIKD